MSHLSKHVTTIFSTLLALNCLLFSPQTLAAFGDKIGVETRVNTYTTNEQTQQSIAMDADGDYVIAWSSVQEGSTNNIYAQRYNADGSPAGGEFRVNTDKNGRQVFSSIAMDADGNFVIVWQDDTGHDSSNSGIFAQRYNADGSPAGGEFLVNTNTLGDQRYPSIAELKILFLYMRRHLKHSLPILYLKPQ